MSAAAVAAVLGTLTNRAFALDSDRALAQLHHTAWTAEDGAPSQIGAITQTSDGYLWIGSARGLFRFDGVEFEHYAPAGAPSHNTYDLLATTDGKMWISFRPSGLGLWESGRLTTFFDADEIPPSQVHGFAHDIDGRLFAGTQEGLFLREGTRWVPVGAEWNLPPGRIQNQFADRDGTLWITTGKQLYALARGSRSFVHQRPMEWVARITQAPSGEIWMASDFITVLSSADRAPAHMPVIHQVASEILADRDGCLWIGTRTDGVQRVASPNDLEGDVWPGDPRIESIGEADGLSAGTVQVLFEDREGNIWIGTGKGLDRFRHNHFVPVTLPTVHQAFTLLPGENGDVWVGTARGSPLWRVNASHVEPMKENMRVASVYRADDGVIWWGGFREVIRQDRGTLRSFPLFPTPSGDWLWEVFRSDVEGALWISVGDRGLYHFQNGEWGERPQPQGLPDRGPSASYHAPDGSIWLGYTENRVCVLTGETVRAYSQADGIGIGRVRVIRGRGANVWVGGELGLALFDNGRFRTIASAGGEPFGTVSGIVETTDGSLWLNEVHGVLHIAPDEVARVVADPAHAVRFRHYDAKEGLPGASQMNWTCSTAIEASDGKLWFATDAGLAWIDPPRMTTNPFPPPVVVRAITTEDGTFSPNDSVRLANRTATLRIDYTALSLSVPERVRFRYRLEGYDRDWVDADTRRAAFYTRLRPGSYRFQVAASNNDGIWNTTGAAAAFAIAPAFYQTKWFAAACLFAIAGSLWLIHRVRVRQVASRLQRLHEERIDERMRIAHELHDTLLQGFLSASMKLQVAEEAIPDSLAAKRQVGGVLDLMDGVIGDARNAVRGMRTTETVELEQAFARIPIEMGVNGAVELRVAVEGSAQPLRPVARDEVYRIGRESIMNALRHAGARRVEAEVHYLARELRVLVRDDGRSIDAEVLRSGRDGHFGLSGMRERATRLGGQLTVRSHPGEGTEIELVVPGRIAFSKTPPVNVWVRAKRWLRTLVAPGSRKE